MRCGKRIRCHAFPTIGMVNTFHSSGCRRLALFAQAGGARHTVSERAPTAPRGHWRAGLEGNGNLVDMWYTLADLVYGTPWSPDARGGELRIRLPKALQAHQPVITLHVRVAVFRLGV
jgi:hypothetical protein